MPLRISKKVRGSSINLENMFYRLILSSVCGYFLGTSFLYKHPDLWQQTCTIINSNFPNLKPLVHLPNEESKPTSNVYIGMMSTEKMLSTRMLAAASTWMKEKSIYVEVISANGNSSLPEEQQLELEEAGVRIRPLEGVDGNVYPPQKKSFALLRHMYDEHVNNFDWFIRLDDDAYVNFEKLQSFLNRVNSSQPLQIGHPGFGKNSQDFLKNGENYCMGGPGVILSRKILMKIRPHLITCMNKIYTEHEDIEIGRCIHELSGVSCTLSWDVRHYFYQNYQGGTYARNMKTLTSKHLSSGLIFHANKDSEYQYKMRADLLKQQISNLLRRINSLNEYKNGFKLSKDKKDYVGENGIAPLKWSTIHKSWHYKTDSQLVQRTEKTLVDIMTENFNQYMLKTRVSKDHEGIYKESKLATSYTVVNPLKGMDIVSQVDHNFDVFTEEEQVSNKVYHTYYHQRFKFVKHSVFLQEPFSLPTFRAHNDTLDKLVTTADHIQVNFVIALSGRSDNFIRFLHNFENAFLTRGERVNLIVSYFPGKQQADSDEKSSEKSPREDVQQAINDQRFIQENVASLQSVYPDNKLQVHLMKAGTEFSRGAGLQSAANTIRAVDEIIFFCDVDLVFSQEILTHIRRNTVQGKKVYYPVFFSQYDPNVVYFNNKKPQSHFSFEELDGFWRYFSYGMVSLYKSDFDKTPGFDLTIRGWGLEDIHLANAILAAGLDVFKSTEPGQVHIYHDKKCDSQVLQQKQLVDCTNSRSTHFGPKTLLYYLWRKRKNMTEEVKES